MKRRSVDELRKHFAELRRMDRVAHGEERPEDLFDLFNCVLMRPDVMNAVLDRVSERVTSHLSLTRRESEIARARFTEHVRR
jgi:hypothetical protein